MTDYYTPPADPYQDDLAKLRAASRPALSTFEEQYKQERLVDLEVTRMALDDEPTAPRLTAAELSSYAPPDGYAAALKRGV